MRIYTSLSLNKYVPFNLSIFCFLACVFMCFSCKKELRKVENLSCDRNISFANDVMPIIELSCNNFACHSSGSASAISLSNHSEISGAVFKNNLLESVKHQTLNPMPRMDPFLPDAYKLNDSIINILECWVNQGALNN